MNWSIFSITLIDNVNSLFSFFDLVLGIIYFFAAFMNLLVDTSETFGVLVLVTFILLQQFNTLICVHNLSSTSQSYALSTTSKKLSLTKLYLSTFLFTAICNSLSK